MNRTNVTRHDLIKFYKDQLTKFYQLGIGGKTEHNVVVTETLLEATLRRLNQIRSSDFKIYT